MNKEDDVKIFDLVIKNNLLPQKLEELVPLSFIGQTAVNFYRDKMTLMEKLDIAEEQKVATLRDGQDAGKMLLAIEARIGELLPSEKEMAQKRSEQYKGRPRLDQRGLKQLPEGITERKSMVARTIAHHPEAVKQVIREAEENEDIPTKTAVLNKVKHKKEMEERVKEEIGKEPKEPKIPPNIDQAIKEIIRDIYLLEGKCKKVAPHLNQLSDYTKEPFLRGCESLLNSLKGILSQERSETDEKQKTITVG